MIRKKKKIQQKIVACALSCGAIFSALFSPFFTAFIGADAESARSSDSIGTAVQNTSAQTDRLFLPSSYEEYLTLAEPSSVAVTENYTAIADGLNIYVYDRTAKIYRKYEHAEITDKKITQLQFDENGTLYFSVQSMDLYSLQIDTLSAQKTNFACNAFDIYDGHIYYTAISGEYASIYSRDLTDLNGNRQEIVPPEIGGKPALSHNGETLYYTDKGNYLNRADDPSYAKKLYSAQGGQSAVQSMTFYGDYCFYTDLTKTLYACRYASSDAAPEKIAENCSAVSAPFAGNIYVVCGKTIKQLNADAREFTDYEISASSPSEGRLSAAADCVLTENALVTLDPAASDAEKTRIHVTPVNGAVQSDDNESFEKKTFYINAQSAKYIATDGATACVADGEENGSLYVYNLNEKSGETLQPIAILSAKSGETFTGVTCVYGNYYAATISSFYALLPSEENGGEYTAYTRESGKTNKLISSDVYGTIYAAHSDLIYAYTESEFLDENTSKSPTDAVAKLPVSTGSPAAKLLIDFDRNVYALQGGALIKCETTAGEGKQTYDLKGKTFVYGQSDSTPISSVAFSVVSSAVYVIYDGNFIAAVYDIPLPSVSAICVNRADEALFSETSADFSVVSCAAHTLLIRFDASVLRGAEYFPYLSHERTARAVNALSLGNAGRFTLLAVYDEENNDYYTALAETASCSAVAADEYLKDPPEIFSADAKGYVTNALPLYKYPYLTPLFTVTTIPKNAEITVLKKVEQLNRPYYQVEYTDENGQTKIGYLPAAYVSDVDGTTPHTDRTQLGEENDRSDLVWRLAYLLLGTLAICILVDYLILRKYNDD